MPGHNGGWLHDSQTLPLVIPDAREQNPEDTVNGPKLGPRPSVYQARELVTKGNILGDEACTMIDDGNDNGANQREL